MKKLFAFALILMSVACGGSKGPSMVGPTEPAPSQVSLVSLRDGSPLGIFSYPGIGPATMTVPGFLPRTVGTVGATESLWPADDRMPESYTFEALYAKNPNGRLFRPEAGSLTVEPSLELQNGSREYAALQWAINTINAVYTDGRFRYVLVPAGSGGQVHMYRDPADVVWSAPGMENAGAYTSQSVATSSGFVTGGRIVFRDFDVFFSVHLQRAMAHELAHMAGMYGHPPTLTLPGLMNSWDGMDFSPEEKNILRWVFSRSPNTGWPDDSTHVLGTSVHTTNRIIAD